MPVLSSSLLLNDYACPFFFILLHYACPFFSNHTCCKSHRADDRGDLGAEGVNESELHVISLIAVTGDRRARPFVFVPGAVSGRVWCRGGRGRRGRLRAVPAPR